MLLQQLRLQRPRRTTHLTPCSEIDPKQLAPQVQCAGEIDVFSTLLQANSSRHSPWLRALLQPFSEYHFKAAPW